MLVSYVYSLHIVVDFQGLDSNIHMRAAGHYWKFVWVEASGPNNGLCVSHRLSEMRSQSIKYSYLHGIPMLSRRAKSFSASNTAIVLSHVTSDVAVDPPDPWQKRRRSIHYPHLQLLSLAKDVLLLSLFSYLSSRYATPNSKQ